MLLKTVIFATPIYPKQCQDSTWWRIIPRLMSFQANQKVGCNFSSLWSPVVVRPRMQMHHFPTSGLGHFQPTHSCPATYQRSEEESKPSHCSPPAALPVPLCDVVEVVWARCSEKCKMKSDRFCVKMIWETLECVFLSAMRVFFWRSVQRGSK